MLRMRETSILTIQSNKLENKAVQDRQSGSFDDRNSAFPLFLLINLNNGDRFRKLKSIIYSQS